jgi:predicted nucleotidyltransferase
MSRVYTIDEIRSLAVPIAQRYGVGKLALFGSYARGEQKSDSDIDFLIEKGDIFGLFQFCGFIDDLEQTLETHVDVLTYDSMKNSLIANALNDEVVLYERA